MNVFKPTASASINFSVWAVLDAMNRSMVTFVYLRFFAMDLVNADPFVTCATSDKPIMPDWVD
jgi:hypothetical protein